MASERNNKSEEEQQASFKEQLDRIAVASREGEQESKPNPIIEKSTPLSAHFDSTRALTV